MPAIFSPFTLSNKVSHVCNGAPGRTHLSAKRLHVHPRSASVQCVIFAACEDAKRAVMYDMRR